MIIQREDGKHKFVKFLAEAYFGSSKNNFLSRYIWRAYRDFSRTLHGMAQHPKTSLLKDNGEQYLSLQLNQLADLDLASNPQIQFDEWHRKTCEGLVSILSEVNLTIGQAQKWVNMTLKYLFTAVALQIEEADYFLNYYEYAHIPIDNRILNKLAPDITITCPWSRIADYDTYLDLQNKVRSKYDQCPMDIEFGFWSKIDDNF